MPTQITIQYSTGPDPEPQVDADLLRLATHLMERQDGSKHPDAGKYSVRPFVPKERLENGGLVLQLTLNWLDDSYDIRQRVKRRWDQHVELRKGVPLFGYCEPSYRTDPLQNMLDRAEPINEVNLRFLSPTMVKHHGRTLPLPYPEAIFAGLASKWNEVLPDDHPSRIANDAAKSLCSHITVEVVEISGAGLRPGDRRSGFVGEVVFGLMPAATPQDRRLLHSLVLFATFSGIGKETSHGFGVADIVGIC
jgi:hypothetical protein